MESIASKAVTSTEKRPVHHEESARYLKTLEIYGRVLSVVLMLFGLRQWAVIVGVASSPGGPFELMTTPWQLVTMYLAVIDLVAAVGLWMRVAWGNVLWILAALSEMALHTFFASTFGTDFTIIAFHLFAMGGYATLFLLAQKEQKAWPFSRR
jgi:hypothetical protein